MTGPDPNTPPPPRPGRGLRLALIASLALNLLFLGLIAGGAMTAAHRAPASHIGPDLRALWRALPDDTRQALRERFRDEAGEPRTDRGQRRARMAEREAELLALLRAEVFDAAAFSSLLESQREGVAMRSEMAQSLLVERLAQFTRAERAALAERYESRRARGSGRR